MAPLANLQVLIVDDERDLADLLAEILASSGAITRVAYDATEALARLEPLPHVVVTDIRMPGMSGIELMKELRRRHSLPVVLVSGFSDLSQADAIQAGAAAIIAKPYTPNQIIKALLAASGRSSSPPQP